MAPRGAQPMVGLYLGEVLGIVYPDNPRSVTKRLIEYRVGAQVPQNGTVATIELPHCTLANPLAGALDRARWTLRADPKSGQKGRPGVGSKVIVACLGGDRNSAVILSGVRDDADEGDELIEGRRLDVTFNGLSVEIDQAGGLTVTRRGPRRDDGKLDEDHAQADAVGALITLDADGGIQLATVRPDGDNRPIEQSVTLDHKEATLTVTGKQTVTVQATDGAMVVTAKGDVDITSSEGAVHATARKGDVQVTAPKGKVKLGTGANQPVPLGNELVSWLTELTAALQTLSVSTAVGPSSPPLNAPIFAKLQASLQRILSRSTVVSAQP